MSKPSNPTLIGAFVLGAVLLLVFAVLLFGGAELFSSKRMLVSYFPESVKGLREGSNVLLGGVRVGYVKSIQLEGQITEGSIDEGESLQTLVEVIMEVQPQTFEVFSEGEPMTEKARAKLTPEEFVRAGVRAQLGIDSLVTGQLLVELNFRPDVEAVFRATRKRYPEVPTMPSDTQMVIERVQQFFAKLSADVDFAQVGKDIQGIASGLNELVNSPELRSMIAGGSRLTNDDLPKLIASMDHMLVELNGALRDTRSLMQHVEREVDPFMAELLPTVKRLDVALQGADQLLQSMSQQLRDDSELSLDLRATLQELQSMSRSAKLLLDYLERHPEALLRGKKQ